MKKDKTPPGKRKRLVGKILALVCCLAVLLSVVVVPSFAFGISENTDPTPQVHPYAPTTISYSSRYMESNGYPEYAVLNTPTAVGNSLGISSNFLGNGIFTRCDTATANDKLNGYFLITLNDTGSSPILNFTHDRFFYDDDYSDLAPQYTITADMSSYWRVYVTGFFSPFNDGNNVTYADNVQVYASQGTVLRFGFDDVINGLRNHFGISSDRSINSSRLTVTVVGYNSENPEDGLNVDLFFRKIECEYPYLSQYTPVPSYIYFPETIKYITPDNFEPSGLFEWLGDAINGVLSAPLLPVGDFTITIGSVVGMFLGISLVIAFLKFFAGG